MADALTFILGQVQNVFFRKGDVKEIVIFDAILDVIEKYGK